jgi:uncharacterized protein YecT (DUF1311 family)
MLQSLLAILILLIFACASFAQQAAKTDSQARQANPCDAATTQADMKQCAAEAYKKADAHLNTVYTNLMRLLQKDTGPAQPHRGHEARLAVMGEYRQRETF